MIEALRLCVRLHKVKEHNSWMRNILRNSIKFALMHMVQLIYVRDIVLKKALDLYSLSMLMLALWDAYASKKGYIYIYE